MKGMFNTCLKFYFFQKIISLTNEAHENAYSNLFNMTVVFKSEFFSFHFIVIHYFALICT